MTVSCKRLVLAAAFVAVNGFALAGSAFASRDYDVVYTPDGKPFVACVDCWFYSCDCPSSEEEPTEMD